MNVDVAIIGAGSAGLAARREVQKQTDNYVLIDGGPLGTTCARAGCMPSKVLIQVANDYHRRLGLDEVGIHGGKSLRVDSAEVMAHVRALRDRFVHGVMSDAARFEDKLLRGYARFVSPTELVVKTAAGDQTVHAKHTIVATGSKPIVPGAWSQVSDLLIDTDAFFELERLPERVAVIGLGVIGLELGQALHRLGVQVQAFTLDKALGGLSDPAVQEEAFDIVSAEMPVCLAGVERLERVGDGLRIHADGRGYDVDRALVTMGRRPVVDGLGLEQIGASLSERGIPVVDEGTYRLGELPIFLVGDANGTRPLLHEASDQGRIAGYNATRDEPQCFKLRTPLVITFSEPNLAIVGQSHRRLVEAGEDFVVGEVRYRGQGRAIVKRQEHGLLRLYARRSDGRLLGTEMAAPDGEHLAHLLAWAVASGMGVHALLSMPFYHPVVQEGVRTALRQAARQVEQPAGELEVLRCQDPPVGCWS